MFKNIDLFKIIVNKKFYIFCAIKKTQKALYKFHIRFKKRSLNLIYNDIYDFITFRDRFNDKYFIIFINDWNKRFKIETIKYKNEIFFIFKRY